MSAADQPDAADSSTEKRDVDSADVPALPTSESTQELTKNQRKKIARRQKLLEKMKANRKNERTKRKERRRLRIANGEIKPASIKSMSAASASNIRVAIDMSFDHLMTDHDVAKLLKQVQRCYAENRRAEHALQFYITGVGGKSEKRFKEAVSGYDKWDVHRKSESILDLFKREEIVYLTSDSSNVLKDLDPNSVYIIGGLVDHNFHKGICLQLALKHGIKHARLPIKKHINLASRSVLCVNHVFEILLAYANCKDWAASLDQVVPDRKRIK